MVAQVPVTRSSQNPRYGTTMAVELPSVFQHELSMAVSCAAARARAALSGTLEATNGVGHSTDLAADLEVVGPTAARVHRIEAGDASVCESETLAQRTTRPRGERE